MGDVNGTYCYSLISLAPCHDNNSTHDYLLLLDEVRDAKMPEDARMPATPPAPSRGCTDIYC